MIKRLIAIAAIFLFLFAAYSRYSYAGLFDSTTAINDALDGGYYTQIGNGLDINYVSVSTLTDYQIGSNYYGCLVYGGPEDVPGNQYDLGEYRYLGFTKNGDKYTNLGFRPDSYANGKIFEEENWIPNPWDNVPGIIKDENDGSSIYAQNIKHGIWIYYSGGHNINGYNLAGESAYPDFWDSIAQYVHILSPPTQYAWGIGRMWHYDESGFIWYMTVPILPMSLLPGNDPPEPPVTYPDYAITSASINAATIETGKTYNVSFNVSQLDPQFADYKTVSVIADRNGISFYSGGLSIRNADGQKTVTIPWTCPGGISSAVITLKVNGGNVPGDSNHAIPENERYSNNETKINITVGQPPGGEDPPEPPSPQYNISGASIYYSNGKTTADFSSTFTMPGTIIIRFYVKNSSGALELKDSRVYNLTALDNVSATFNYTTDNTIVAAANCYYSGGSWVPEKYHGSDNVDRLETTYSDNILRITPSSPPQISYHGENSVQVTVKVVEEKITYKTEDVYGWRQIPYILDKSKPRVRVYLTE